MSDRARIDTRQLRSLLVEVQLAARLGRSPTEDEIAAAAQLTRSELADLRRSARTVTSLDFPLGQAGDGTLHDILPSNEVTTEEEITLRLGIETLAELCPIYRTRSAG